MVQHYAVSCDHGVYYNNMTIIFTAAYNKNTECVYMATGIWC